MSFGLRRKKRVFNKSTGRDYTYDTKYESSPEQKRNRAQRNAARRKLIRKGHARVGDGKDVNHKKPIAKGGTNSSSNLEVISKSKNRGFRRTSNNRPK